LYKSGGKRDDCFPSGDKFEMLELIAQRQGNIGSGAGQVFHCRTLHHPWNFILTERFSTFSLIVAISHVKIKKEGCDVPHFF
jgi:hypothetical protein